MAHRSGPAHPAARPRRRGRGAWLLVAGILILLSPIVLTFYTDYHLDLVTRSYEQSVKAIKPDSRTQEYLDGADAYNTALAAAGHHAMPPQDSSPGFQDYLRTLDAPETGGVIARITVPSVTIDLPVYHGTAPAVLYKGAGHMFGTDLPVGGPGRTSVISAHTGMVNASMFDNLPRVKDGADIYVTVMGERHHYRVRRRQVVGPTDTKAITYEPGVDKLVLVTCTPYGINTDRLLVEAVRVADGDGGATAVHWVPRLSWWMVLDLVLIVLALLWVLLRDRRDRHRAAQRRRSQSASGGRTAGPAGP